MSRVWVVGSINADTVLRVDHLPRPGETTTGELSVGLGGKGANQAVAAARAGAQVSFAGAVGDDEAGATALAALEAEGIDVVHVRHVGGPTGAAFVSVDRAGENSIVVVAGANGRVDPSVVATLPVEAHDVVVAQGELATDTSSAAMHRAGEVGAMSIWNPAPADPGVSRLLTGLDVLVVNQVELAMLSGDQALYAGVEALHRLGAAAVVATSGSSGVLAWRDREFVTTPAESADVVDTTGAGDCFVGVLAAQLVAKTAFDVAVATAVTAAAIAVGRRGAASSMPTAADIDRRRRG